MTQEDKELLLKDLSARLSYGILMSTPIGDGHLNSINQTIFGIELGINVNQTKRDKFDISLCFPYLRPMSSMTGEELKEVRDTCKHRNVGESVLDNATIDTFDYLNAHHFDYRDLISKGLALEAPEGMYNV